MDKPIVRDLTLLVYRAVLGGIFVAHGLQRVFLQGLTETTTKFTALHIPQPKLSAYLVTGTEIVCGALLIIGILSTLFASILALLAFLALYFVHLGHGFFIENGGFEYVLLLASSLLLLVVFGPGRLSLDWVLVRHDQL